MSLFTSCFRALRGRIALEVKEDCLVLFCRRIICIPIRAVLILRHEDSRQSSRIFRMFPPTPMMFTLCGHRRLIVSPLLLLAYSPYKTRSFL